MKSYIQILGTETGDSSPSILIFFDDNRYLFNIGEGLQRFSLEYKIKLSRITDIFLTRLTWKNIGGLPGTLLSLIDSGSSSISLSGPVKLTNFFGSLRYFLQRFFFIKKEIIKYLDIDSIWKLLNFKIIIIIKILFLIIMINLKYFQVKNYFLIVLFIIKSYHFSRK